MDRSSRNDFNIVAVPPPALALRLANLIEANAGSFITGLGRGGESERRHRERERERDDELLTMVHAVYEATQSRILDMFDIDDEASRLAIEEIDQELARNARERRDMIDRSVKLDDGAAVFLSEDGENVYRENGQRLDENRQHDLLAGRRPELEQAPRWEAFAQNDLRKKALVAERGEIVAKAEERVRLRRDVESGQLDQDELEQLESRYEQSLPDRVRRHRAGAEAATPDNEKTLPSEEISRADAEKGGPRLRSHFSRSADPILAEPAAEMSAPSMTLRQHLAGGPTGP